MNSSNLTKNLRVLTAFQDGKHCATGETKLWLSPSTKKCQTPCSGYPPVYQDLNTRHDWSVKNAIVDLPIRTKENSKRASSNLLGKLGAQNKNIRAASQTLLRVDFQRRASFTCVRA